MRPLVLLDCDGILFRFVETLFSKIEEHYGVKYEPETFTQFDFSDLPNWNKAYWGLCQMGGFTSAQGGVFPGAVEGVNALREIADVEVCTSPYKGSLTWCGEREQWLKQHFGFEPDEIHFTHKKHLMRASYLVDDRAENAETFSENKYSTGVLWTRSYNMHSKHSPRIASWEELIAVIQRPKSYFEIEIG